MSKVRTVSTRSYYSDIGHISAWPEIPGGLRKGFHLKRGKVLIQARSAGKQRVTLELTLDQVGDLIEMLRVTADDLRFEAMQLDAPEDKS